MLGKSEQPQQSGLCGQGGGNIPQPVMFRETLEGMAIWDVHGRATYTKCNAETQSAVAN